MTAMTWLLMPLVKFNRIEAKALEGTSVGVEAPAP
jgi:hypothetical protein